MSMPDFSRFSEEPVEPLDVTVDMDEYEADWIKQTWDIDASNVDELRGYLAQCGWRAEDFANSAVYLNCVGTERWLKAAVEQLVAEQYT